MLIISTVVQIKINHKSRNKHSLSNKTMTNLLEHPFNRMLIKIFPQLKKILTPNGHNLQVKSNLIIHSRQEIKKVQTHPMEVKLLKDHF